MQLKEWAKQHRVTLSEAKAFLRDGDYGSLSPDANLTSDQLALLGASQAEAARLAAAPAPEIFTAAEAVATLERPPDAVGRVPRQGRLGAQVLLHEDVLSSRDRLQPAVRKRLTLVLRQLAVSATTSRRKTCQGAGKGWWRTPLGGNGGMQFYLWWATGTGPILKEHGLSGSDVFVRAIRGHDTMDALDPGAPRDWLPVDADMLSASGDLGDDFLTAQQSAAVASLGAVRIFRGQAGVGKTLVLTAAIERAAGRKAVFVTYNRTLAVRTERELRAFAPEGLELVVLTFDDLVGLCAPPGITLPAPLSPASAAKQLEDALAERNVRLGPWQERPEALYALLHAEVAGSALTLDEPLRAALGKTKLAADRTAFQAVEGVVRELEREGRHEALFPAPARARLAAGHVDAPAFTVPPLLAGADWFLVDEVQDLTQLEVHFLIELLYRISDEGRHPLGIGIAGDEGQTVRPTGFDWGWLNMRLGQRLARPEVISLVENRRSPSNIARLGEKVGELYRLIDKKERPRGSPDAEADDLSTGRVSACLVRSAEEFEAIRRAVSELPESAIVVPWVRGRARSFALPEPRPELGVWSAEDAKGLDFRHVLVPLAGESMLELRRLTNGADWLGGQRARAIIDHLRVAVSRATDSVILLVDADDPSALQQVEELAADLPGFGLLEIDAMLTELQDDFGDAVERAAAALQEALTLLSSNAAVALRRARQAVTALGAQRGASTRDDELRRRAHRARGLAALACALSEPDAPTRGKLFVEANRALNDAKLAESARGVLAVRDLSSDSEKAPERARELVQTLAVVGDQVPEVFHLYRGAIVDAARGFAARLPPTAGAIQKVVDAVRLLRDELGARHPELAGVDVELRRAAAHRLAALGETRRALALLVGLAPRDPEAEALCHEKLGQHEQAAAAYEAAGRVADAIRLYRVAGEFESARGLAAEQGLPEAATLAWILDLQARLHQVPSDVSASERRLLTRLAKQKLAPGE